MKNYSRDIKGITFSASLEEELQSVLAGLFRTIAQTPSEEIRDGYMFQFGFNVFTLAQNDSGYQVLAPDYGKNPFEDSTGDLTTALRIKQEQDSMLRTYDLEGECTRLDHVVAIAKDRLQDDLVFMQRVEMDEGLDDGLDGEYDSGWLISSLESDKSDFEYHRAYELLAIRPALMKALSMPYGYKIAFQGDEIVAVVNGQDEMVDPLRSVKDYTQEINGISFSAMVEESLHLQLEALFHAFGKATPERYQDGFALQMGFSAFTLAKGNSGYRILAPDYTNSPFLDSTQDLSLALWVQMQQSDILRTFGIEGEAVRFDDKLLAATDSLQGEYICMQRYPDLVKNGFCGWAIESARKNEKGIFEKIASADYDSYYAYELLGIRPSIVKALGLPLDYIAIFDNDEILEILDDQNEGLIEKSKGGQNG